MKLPFPGILLHKSSLAVLALSLIALPVHAQGLAGVAIPKSGDDPAAVYHAKVRELITTALQKWTQSLERKDSAAVASLYAVNVRSIIGDEVEAVTPAGVVKQLYKTPLPGAQLAITIDDFDMSGEMAFVTCILVARGESADAVPAFIRSVFVFRFDDWHERWQVRQQTIDWRGASQPTAPAQ